MTTGCITAAILIMVLGDCVERAAAKSHIVDPGERWYTIGDNLTIRCILTGKAAAMYKKTQRILKFSLRNSSKSNRRQIRNQFKSSRHNSYVDFTLPNITGAAEGIYWCARKPNLRNNVHVLVVDSIRRPENITCVFHGKRTLNCTYSVHDSIGYNQYTCSAGERRLGRINSLQRDFCPAKILKDLQGTGGMQNSTETGVCEYRCGSYNCLENIILVIHAKNTLSKGLFCHIAELGNLRKPGPVRDLQVTNVTSTSLSVQWTKPDDHNNRYDTYQYIVRWDLLDEGVINITEFSSEARHVPFVISKLQAGRQYKIAVNAKPDVNGFTSEPSSKEVSTIEDVPASGPVVPPGSYSVQALTALGIYWQIMPEKERRGKITQYEIQIGDVVVKNTSKTWTTLELPVSDKDVVIVTLRAATKVGYSTINTTLRISKDMLQHQPVTSVQRVSERVVWKHTGSVPNTVRAHRCFGNQSNERQQLVDCQTEIECMNIADPGQGYFNWSNPPAPALPCEGCQWHYAVSFHINNNTAGMVWNTDPEPTKIAIILTTLAILVASGCVLFSFGVLIRKKLTCKSYDIILPKQRDNIEDWQPAPDEHCGHKPSSKNATAMKSLRDSGHESMDTNNDHNPHPSRSSENEAPFSELETPLLNVIELKHDSDGTFLSSGSGPGLDGGADEDDESATDATGYSEDSCGYGFEDDSKGSLLSDYRLQLVIDTDVKEDVDEERDIWVDNKDAFSGNLDDLWRPCHEQQIKSGHEDHFSLTSSFSSPQSASHPQAASYSQVSLPFKHDHNVLQRPQFKTAEKVHPCSQNSMSSG